jgi:hypothetical protein
MRGLLGKLLAVAVALLLLPLRAVWALLGIPVWLAEAITGDQQRALRLRKSLQERPPLPDADFIAQAGAPPQDTAVWLATRRALAACCYLPETALHPEDPLSTIEILMRTRPSAHWWDIGADSIEMLMRLEESLGVAVPEEEYFRRAEEAAGRGQFLSLRDLAALVAEIVRGHGGIPRQTAG